MSSTHRQQIADVLRTGPWTVTEISKKLGMPIKRVVEDLEHVRMSVTHAERWIVKAAECLECGFVFRGRDRLNRPSRCPICRSEDIQDARYEIRSWE